MSSPGSEPLGETRGRWFSLAESDSVARATGPRIEVPVPSSGALTPGKATAANLPPGTVLGERYRLDSALGRGGQGVVYRGVDLEAPRLRRVAIKVRLCPSEGPPILAGLRHVNIQGFLDWGREGEFEFCVLRFHDSPDLRTRLEREGPSPAPLVARWGAALLRALGHLHRRNVLHRDVKPCNVLLAGQRPVLIDFDLACVGSRRERGLVGTPLYMSPERLAGQPASRADDVFACALTVYELVAGSLPTGPQDPETLEDLRRARQEPLPSCGDSGLDLILAQALDPGPERLRSARALGKALRAFAKDAGQPDLPTPPPLPELG